MFRTSLQTLWKHGQKVLKNVARAEVRQQPRFVEQESNLVQSVDTTPLTWMVFRSVAKEVRKGLSQTVFSPLRQPEFLTSTSRGLRGRMPLLSLIAGGLVIRSQMDEADTPSDSMLAVIKNMWKTEDQSSPVASKSLDKKSSDFAFSELIGRGCNSAVYSAWEKTDMTGCISPNSDSSEDTETSSISSESSAAPEYFTLGNEWSLVDVSDESSEEVVVDIEASSSSDSFESNDLPSSSADSCCDATEGKNEVAVKIIFNYRAASNEQQIIREFTSELVPSSMELADVLSEHWQNNHKSKMKHLPPHPNIVSIQSAFVDVWPCGLPDTHQFPLALPHYLSEDGCGRNQTLFLVMDKYPHTLDMYLKTHALSTEVKTMIVLQLVEALVHMSAHQVSHRDLKLDNVLCREEKHGQLSVAISDFGSCVAGELVLPYVTDQTAKGGNWAHLAPEIAQTQPGVYSKLDYRKADIWSVGVMACEIFAAGKESEFADWLKHVANKKPEHIDPLPMFDSDELSRCVGKVVKAMLSADPAERPDARVLSNIFHMWLWGPCEWRRDGGLAGLSLTAMRRWIVLRAAHDFVRCRLGNESVVSASLKTAFYAGLTADNVRDTINWLHNL